jgi:hypothetical protein
MGASLGAGVGLVDGLLDTGAAEGAQEISSTGGHVTGGQVTGGQLMVGWGLRSFQRHQCYRYPFLQ